MVKEILLYNIGHDVSFMMIIISDLSQPFFSKKRIKYFRKKM